MVYGLIVFYQLSNWSKSSCIYDFKVKHIIAISFKPAQSALPYFKQTGWIKTD